MDNMNTQPADLDSSFGDFYQTTWDFESGYIASMVAQAYNEAVIADIPFCPIFKH